MKRLIPKDFDDWLLLMTGTIVLAAILGTALFWMSATPTNTADEAGEETSCSPSDYAHVPNPDQYTFECNEDSMTVTDANDGTVVAIEERCTGGDIKAEDGSCVNEDFYTEGE